MQNKVATLSHYDESSMFILYGIQPSKMGAGEGAHISKQDCIFELSQLGHIFINQAVVLNKLKVFS